MQRIYRLYKKEKNVGLVHLPDEEHDYGPSKRKVLYSFMAKHLRMNLKAVTKSNGEVDESATKVLDQKELEVFNEANPRPANAVMGDAAVLKLLEK